MKLMRRVMMMSAVVALAACGGDAANEDNAQDAVGAPEAGAPAGMDAPRVEGSGDVRLTRERFESWMAAIDELTRVAGTSPEVADAIAVNADEKTEDAIARLKRHPEIVAALRKHGFTAESYVGFMLNIMYAMGAHSAREEGYEVPGTYPVNEDDVRFIAENRAWVEEQWSRMEEQE